MRTYYTFENGKEMLELIQSGIDLYHEGSDTYVFVYNDYGSICTYDIGSVKAYELSKQKKADGECWSAHLGWGGCIYDDPSHELYKSGQQSNLDFCNENFDIGYWEVV